MNSFFLQQPPSTSTTKTAALRLSLDQERRLKKLARRVGRVTQADRQFFERFPNRQHRVRLASQAEIEQNTALLGGGISNPPRDQQYFVAVKNVAPGYRLRLVVVGPQGADTDLNEEDARAIYEVVNYDRARQVEAEMRTLADAQRST